MDRSDFAGAAIRRAKARSVIINSFLAGATMRVSRRIWLAFCQPGPLNATGRRFNAVSLKAPRGRTNLDPAMG